MNVSSWTSGVTASAASNVVTLTCINAGTFCNSYAVTSTSTTEVSTAAFSGGVNPVVVTVGGAQFTAAVSSINANQFNVGANTTAMAANLATQIAASSNTVMITAASAGTVVSATATVAGAAGNSFATLTSNALAISTAALRMSGGQDNANVCINGTCWTANSSFYPVTSTGQTATNLAAAILASSTTTGIVAAAGGSVVYATATVVGTGANSYAVTVTTNAITPAVFVSSNAATGAQVGTFSGGLNSGYVFNGTGITASGNNLQTGEAVVWSTGSGVTVYYSTGAVGTGATSVALAIGTTYYAIAGNPNLQLAVKTTQDTFTLNLSSNGVISGTPTLTWVTSEDGSDWVTLTTTPFNITVPAMTYATYVATGTVNNFDFGHIDYGWLGVTTVSPTAGAVNFNVRIVGKQN